MENLKIEEIKTPSGGITVNLWYDDGTMISMLKTTYDEMITKQNEVTNEPR
jgi:hypothetical protein